MNKFLLGFLVFFTQFLALGAGSDVQRQGEPFNNLLIDANPGFENGLSRWTSSGGTFTKNTTLSNVARGTTSGAWNSSSTGQTLTSKQITIPSGSLSKACVASALVKGGDATLTFKVIDGSIADVGTPLAFAGAYSAFTKLTIAFTCPASGTIAVRFTTTSDAPVVYVDEIFLGQQDTPARTGVADGSNAVTGEIGEYVENFNGSYTVQVGSNFGDAGSVTVTAGDWITCVQGNMSGGSAGTGYYNVTILTVPGNDSTGAVAGDNFYELANVAGDSGTRPAWTMCRRDSVTSTTTFYNKMLQSAGTAATARTKIWSIRLR